MLVLCLDFEEENVPLKERLDTCDSTVDLFLCTPVISIPIRVCCSFTRSCGYNDKSFEGAVKHLFV